MRLLAVMGASTAVLLHSMHAQAETFSLGIEDPPGCADKQRLIEQVRARAKGVTFLPSGGRWNFFLRLERREKKVFAELQIGGPDKPQFTRFVDGDSCQEVTAAAALIMALMLDTPTSSIPEREPGGDAAREPSLMTPEPSASAGAPAKQPTPVTTAIGSQQSPITTARSGAYSVEGDFSEPVANKFPESASQSPPWRVGIGAELRWTSLFTNSGMWLLGLRGEGARGERLFTTVRAFVGPKVVRNIGNDATAGFSFYGVGFELGTRVVGSRSLATDALLAASTGGLLFSGIQQSQLTHSHTETATWVGLGPGLRLRWFSDAASLAFQVEAPVSLVRPRFVGFEQVLYQTPPVGIFFGLSGTWIVESSSDARRIRPME